MEGVLRISYTNGEGKIEYDDYIKAGKYYGENSILSTCYSEFKIESTDFVVLQTISRMSFD